tara:strand:+ start:131 stop:511 length:381 start_codon:yes stop_codon:yes gene_type:complete
MAARQPRKSLLIWAGLAAAVILLCVGSKTRPFAYEGMQGAFESDKDHSGKLVADREQMVMFFMNGCPHCKKIEPKWNDYKEGTNLMTRQFEVSAAPNVCKSYGIQSFPQFRHLDQSGEVISTERPI